MAAGIGGSGAPPIVMVVCVHCWRFRTFVLFALPPLTDFVCTRHLPVPAVRGTQLGCETAVKQSCPILGSLMSLQE